MAQSVVARNLKFYDVTAVPKTTMYGSPTDIGDN